jgi:hypothetical protein
MMNIDMARMFSTMLVKRLPFSSLISSLISSSITSFIHFYLLFLFLQALNQLINYKEHSKPFLQKVSKRDVVDYYDIITHPMDLTTMQKKVLSLFSEKTRVGERIPVECFLFTFYLFI